MNEESLLILDDEPFIRELFSDVLSDEFRIITSHSGYNALDILDREEIVLALVDINMPEMNGIEFIHRAKENHPDTAFIIISGNSDINDAIDALHNGVWDFIRKPCRDFKYLKSVIKKALTRRNLIIENRQYKDHLEKMVEERTEELKIKNQELIYSRIRIIGVLSRAAEYKDYETGQHFIRVSLYSSIIARGLRLSQQYIELIEEAAPVHDIGKIGIPEIILLKQGKLTDDEYEQMKKHCQYGEDILKSPSFNLLIHSHSEQSGGNHNLSDSLLETASKIAMYHHERYDGSGYPMGLKEEQIPLEARIVAVADVYDAIGTDRSYKKAWSERECQDYIYNESGISFDPEVVESFFKSIDDIVEIKNSFKDIYSLKKSYI